MKDINVVAKKMAKNSQLIGLCFLFRIRVYVGEKTWSWNFFFICVGEKTRSWENFLKKNKKNFTLIRDFRVFAKTVAEIFSQDLVLMKKSSMWIRR